MYLPFQLERKQQLCLHDDIERVKGGGRAPPTHTSLGGIYHHDGMYARKCGHFQSICNLLSVVRTQKQHEVTERDKCESRIGEYCALRHQTEALQVK